MNFAALVRERRPFLLEGSVFERLVRDPQVEVDPLIFNASLIYDDYGAKVLERVHRDYLDVGQRVRLPMVALTDTWRANPERIAGSAFKGRPVNEDAAAFICRIRDSYDGAGIFVAGMTGPRGDGYKPDEALSPNDAEQFHRQQCAALVAGGVDFLFGMTLPAVCEAEGIARAMATTGMPYMLSFVVRRDGTVLCGTPLAEAVRILDETEPAPPVAYFINCVHPTVASEAMDVTRARRSRSGQALHRHLRQYIGPRPGGPRRHRGTADRGPRHAGGPDHRHPRPARLHHARRLLRHQPRSYQLSRTGDGCGRVTGSPCFARRLRCAPSRLAVRGVRAEAPVTGAQPG